MRNGGRKSSGSPGAHSLRVFGSVARGDANEDSNLDLLVAWEPGRSRLDHAGLVQDLQELLGTTVHVGTEKSLHWYVLPGMRDRSILVNSMRASAHEPYRVAACVAGRDSGTPTKMQDPA